jgi:hypothetical protein
MARLISSTREFLERELAGPAADEVEEPHTAALSGVRLTKLN